MAAGATTCGCGYDRVEATTGRPRMSEIMALPESPLMGRGLNFNMSFGILLCLAGAAIAVGGYQNALGNIAHPYWVAAGCVAMGVLRYGRGCAQCRAD
jgi:hypothetical protein